MQDIADRATVTRLTVSKVEHGDPTVSMGIYARVLFALNLEKRYLFPNTVHLFNATSCHYLISNLGLTGSVSLMM